MPDLDRRPRSGAPRRGPRGWGPGSASPRWAIRLPSEPRGAWRSVGSAPLRLEGRGGAWRSVGSAAARSAPLLRLEAELPSVWRGAELLLSLRNRATVVKGRGGGGRLALLLLPCLAQERVPPPPPTSDPACLLLLPCSAQERAQALRRLGTRTGAGSAWPPLPGARGASSVWRRSSSSVFEGAPPPPFGGGGACPDERDAPRALLGPGPPASPSGVPGKL